MSERGSFITEYIYCDKCFEACKHVLCDSSKYLYSLQIGDLPIIAGKIGGLFKNEELVDMEDVYIPLIRQKMCPKCKIRISVLAEQGSAIYEFGKNYTKNLLNGGNNE